jgi:hypothetical protein
MSDAHERWSMYEFTMCGGRPNLAMCHALGQREMQAWSKGANTRVEGVMTKRACARKKGACRSGANEWMMT